MSSSHAAVATTQGLLPAEEPMQNVFHMPVAPQIVARTRFSPPPATTNHCLSTSDALHLLKAKMAHQPNKDVGIVVISGPGDPLATPEITLDICKRINSQYPTLRIGLQTYGIGSSMLAAKLAQAGVSHIEMQTEAVRAEIIKKLFAWIRPERKTVALDDAAHILINEQSSGVSACKFQGLTVSILTTLYPGYNIDHVAKISSEMKEFGADSICLIPYIPSDGAEVTLQSPSPNMIAMAKDKAAVNLPVTKPILKPDKLGSSGKSLLVNGDAPQPSRDKPYVAVVSSNGIQVDLHLGHAITFLIYEKKEDRRIYLVETRNAPAPGSGAQRWKEVADILHDCFLLLAASAGKKPRRILAEKNLRVGISEQNIAALLDILFSNDPTKR